MAKRTMTKATKPKTTKNGNAKKRPWTDADKERAIAVYMSGKNLSQTSRETGVPISTLRGWLAEESPEEIAKARLDAKTRFINEAWNAIMKGLTVGNTVMSFLLENGDKIDKAYQAVCDVDLPERDKVQILKVLANVTNISLKDIAIYVGTLYDKIALATGKPTAINEQQGQVTTRHEYDIVQRIVTDPESRDIARDLFRRAIGADLEGGRTA